MGGWVTPAQRGLWQPERAKAFPSPGGRSREEENAGFPRSGQEPGEEFPGDGWP